MVIQKQNNQLRYTKSFNIFMIGLLTLVFVVRVGILIQKGENDILSLSGQIQSEAEQVRQKTHIRVLGNKLKKNITTNTGTQVGTGITNSSGSK